MGSCVIFQKVCIGGTYVKLRFSVRIGTLGRGDFFQVGLGNSMYKSSEYKFQTKKMILIANIFFVGAKFSFASCS